MSSSIDNPASRKKLGKLLVEVGLLSNSNN